jgi:hypothetical protein
LIRQEDSAVDPTVLTQGYFVSVSKQQAQSERVWTHTLPHDPPRKLSIRLPRASLVTNDTNSSRFVN